MPTAAAAPLVGVLALQGAFEEHQQCLEAVGCRTVQVRTPLDLQGLHGIVLPGGESTAMGLLGTKGKNENLFWETLQEFCKSKPTWGTCAGMILLADSCVGTSAVIENGQALIGGMDVLVCRNYFGSQISSFEMPIPAPPAGNSNDSTALYPGVFIRAPAILSAGPHVQILAKVTATPCRQAAATLRQLEQKIQAKQQQEEQDEEKKEVMDNERPFISLPGASTEDGAREVICAVRKDNVLCTAFHPELTTDYRWHDYFANIVRQNMHQ